MKIIVVGNGCTWFERNDTSFIIDDKILLDTPAGSYKHILKQIDIFKLDGIIISHFHSDHFGDFRVFAIRFMRDSEKWGRTQKLKVFAPAGVLDKLVEVNKLFCGAEDETDKEKFQKHIDFIEIDDGFEFELSGYEIQASKVDHGKNVSYAFMFTEKNGKKILFSGDTRECDALLSNLESCNVAFVDMASTEPSRTHLDTNSFIRLQKRYSNCNMIPMHMSDESLRFAKDNGLLVLNDFDKIII